MKLAKRAIGTYCADRSGPTLIVTIAALVLLAFAVLFVFQHHGREATPSQPATPLEKEHTLR